MATYPTAAPSSTLEAIQVKVRRLTRSPSEAQLTVDDLNNYINTSVVYDFPEHLRTFNLKKEFTFFTNPYQDEYPTDIASFGTNPLAQNNPLYDFQNKYLTVHPPHLSLDINHYGHRTVNNFFGIYPKVNFIQQTANTGDGVTTTFTGVINTQQSITPSNFQQNIALLQRQVLFSSLDSNLEGLALVDVPVIDPGTGNTSVIGNLYDPNSAAYQAALVTPPTVPLAGVNVINYATGAYTITFASAPGAQARINSQTVPQILSLPQSILYYQNKFTVRPVPDQPYRVNFEVFQAPTRLLETDSEPALKEYWQFIAYMTAKKIFEDRMDMESVQMIMPEFRMQMNLCNRRTLVQLSNERTATIYTQQTSTGSGWNGWNNNY